MVEFDNHDIVKPALDKVIAAILTQLQHDAVKVIWLSVDFRMLIAATGLKHTDAQKAAGFILESVISSLDVEQTLIVPTFYFGFPQSKVFDRRNSPVQTGVFGGLLLEKYAANRIVQPFYSFLVFGKQAEPLLNQRFLHSTGPNSIFEWVVEQNTRVIAVGHHYVKSLTSIHHAEQMAAVSYRYEKFFAGVLLQDGQQEPLQCGFYVRELGVCDFSSLTLRGDNKLRDEGMVASCLIMGMRRPLLLHIVDHYPVHKLLVADLNRPEPQFVDYYGPQRANVDVINSVVADKLYQAELNSLA
ncbi:AAC(3) family N-acetyltransferase [Pseudoalteromonas fenneropenaei]|uniref:Aminoglycoside N(3)-acetyltransferase n=1 Tax=Pseudoalteromonas fenneropenaei TaxID=1737459 RepID=A0ABV7CH07_9GAMM